MEGDRQLWIAAGIDNSQMKRDAEKTIASIKDIGKSADLEGMKLENMFKRAGKASSDTFGETIPHDFKESIAAQKDFIGRLEDTYKSLQKQAPKAAPGKDWLKAQYLLNSAGKELQEEKASLVEMEMLYGKNSDSLKALRTQMTNVREEMIRMTMAGENNTKEYEALRAKLEEMGVAYKHVYAEQKSLTSGGSQWAGMISGLQGFMGVYAAGRGVMSMFITDNEKLMRVQTQLQSVMSIMIGLQQTSAAFHQTSAFRITTVRKVTELWAIAQNKVTAAIGGSAIAAKLLMGAATLGLSVVIGGVITALSKWSAKQGELKKQQQEAIRIQKEHTESIASGVAVTLVEYKRLQSTWLSLNGNAKAQNKFIKENKDAFTSLGVSVKDVNGAENLFVKNEQAFIKSMLVRAKVAAAMELAAEKYKKAIEKMMEAGTVTDEDRQKALDNWMEENHKDLPQDEWLKKFFEASGERDAEVAAMAENNAKERSGAAKFFKEGDEIISKSLLADSSVAELLKALGIETIKGIDESGSKLIEAQKTLAKSILSAELDLQKSKIALMKEGRLKELAELELSTKEKLAKIDEDQQKLAEEYQKAGKKMPAEQMAVFDGQRANTKASALDQKGEIEKKYAKELSDIYTQLSDVFLTEEERKQKAINSTYNEIRKQAKASFQSGDITSEQYDDIAAKARAAKTQASLAESLEQFKTYKQKELDLAKEYSDKIAQLESHNVDGKYDGQIAEAKEQREKGLSALRRQQIEENGVWEKLFGDLGDLSTDTLLEVFSQAEALIAESTDLSAADLKALMDKIKEAREETTARSPFDALKKSFEEYRKARKSGDKDTKVKAWNNTRMALNESRSLINDLGGSLTGMLENIGIQIPESIKNALAGVDQIFAGLASMDVTKPMTVVTGIFKTIGGLGQAIGSVFGGGGGRKLISEQAFTQYSNLMSTINEVLARQKELLGGLIGKAATQQAEESVRLIQKQIDASRQLGKDFINSGASGGTHSFGVRQYRDIKKYWGEIDKLGLDFRSWGGRTEGLFDLDVDDLIKLQEELPEMWASLKKESREYLEAIIKGETDLEEIARLRDESLTGLTFDSLKSSLDSLIVSADLAFSDIGDSFEEHMSKAILNIVKEATLEDGLKKWYDDFAKVMDDGELSESEAEVLRKKYEEIIKGGNEAYKNAMDAAGIDIFGDTASREASSKGFASMSQDSADELNGRFTVIQGHTFSLSENMKVVTANSAAILNHVAGINENTHFCRRLDGMDADLASIKSGIQDINTKGVAIQ